MLGSAEQGNFKQSTIRCMYYRTEKDCEIARRGYEFERTKPGFFKEVASNLKLAHSMCKGSN